MYIDSTCSKINKNIKNIVNNTTLKEFIGEEDYNNYTLFDFLNVYKIKRMYELNYINDITEKQLITLYKKYNTKKAETSRYSDYPDFLKIIREEMTKIEDELESFNIHPNRKNHLITIENMVQFEINQDSYKKIEYNNSLVLSNSNLNKISNGILKKIYNKYMSKTDFMIVYNFLKIQLLSENRFIGTDDAVRVEEEYLNYIKNPNGKAYKELSRDPYNLNFENIKFDITTYIDWTIENSLQKEHRNSKYISKRF